MRNKGLSTLIIDNQKTISEIFLGIILRATAHGLKIALVDTNNSSTKYIQALENFSLSKEFKKKFKKIHIETFSKTPTGISRGILPVVEYQTISADMMYRELYKFDIVLIDHPDSSFLQSSKTLSLLKNKREETEIFISTSTKPFTTIASQVDSIITQEITTQKSLLSNPSISLITPTPWGNLYSYGRMFLEFLKKEQVKYIAFDKADLFYGEHIFFDAIKIWKKHHKLYGEFDYLVTGIPRHTGPQLRTFSTPADKKEASEGLELLKTSLKKQTPVVIDNIDEAIKHELLSKENILDVIKKSSKEVLIPTTLLIEEITPLAGKTITFKSDTKPAIKKGIYF